LRGVVCVLLGFARERRQGHWLVEGLVDEPLVRLSCTMGISFSSGAARWRTWLRLRGRVLPCVPFRRLRGSCGPSPAWGRRAVWRRAAARWGRNGRGRLRSRSNSVLGREGFTAVSIRVW